MHRAQMSRDQVSGRGWWLFLPFGLLNATVAGIAGIAVPLFAGEPRLAGIASALLNIGLTLGAPLSAGLSQRIGAKVVLIGSLLVAGLAFLVLAVPQPALFLGGTFLFGICASAGLTLSTLFVMGWYPRPHWDTQIGWLQTWMGGGQVLGLVVTVFVLSRFGVGLLGMALTVGAGVVAVLLPAPATQTSVPPPVHHTHPYHAAPTEMGGGIALHHLAVFAPQHWPIFRQRTLYPFFWQWGLAMLGGGPIFAVYPLLMRQQFGVHQSQSAWGFAVAALVGIGLYEPAGRWSQRLGASTVLVWSYGIRGGGLFLMALACWTHAAGGWALVGFGLVVLSWSGLTVASNARITAVGSATAGAELGAFYAVTTLAKVVGSLVGGVVIVGIGYGSTLFLSGVFLAVAALWTRFTLSPRPQAAQHDSSQATSSAGQAV